MSGKDIGFFLNFIKVQLLLATEYAILNRETIILINKPKTKF